MFDFMTVFFPPEECYQVTRAPHMNVYRNYLQEKGFKFSFKSVRLQDKDDEQQQRTALSFLALEEPAGLYLWGASPKRSEDAPYPMAHTREKRRKDGSEDEGFVDFCFSLVKRVYRLFFLELKIIYE
jgi:hypothetical protein